MKKFLNYALCTSLLVALSFISCQSEDPLEVQVNEEQTLMASSSTAQLIENMVSNDGSHDNIVDGSSCFDISLPYTVIVNELEITVSSDEDLEVIEKLFDAIDYDDDVLDIVFPITITKADYTEVILNGIEDLMEISTQCVEGGSDDDIECIDIIYPVTIFKYNPNLQETGSITVNSDKDMRLFFAGLNVTDLISIEFPVQFQKNDGTTISVNNNIELADAIERAKEACDEDDDNDHSDDDFTIEGLDSLLLKCPMKLHWMLSGNLLEGDYRAYYLVLSDHGVINAIDSEGLAILGEWSTHWIENRVLLRFNFEDIPALNYDWYVNEIDEDKIQLFIDESVVKVSLQADCDYEVLICNEDFIKENLQNCKWAVSSVEGESFLDALRIDFSFMNIHVYNPNGTLVDEGNWGISETTLVFNNLSTVMANYVGEWRLIECSANRFKLQRGDEYLVVEKDCE